MLRKSRLQPVWRYFLSTSHATPVASRSVVYSQGLGVYGSLGVGDVKNRKLFVPMQLPDNFEPKGISAGYGHSAVWSTTGELFICGIPVEFRRVIRMSTMTDIYIPFGITTFFLQVVSLINIVKYILLNM